MGKSLNGKELGKGISQRKDGLYQGRFVNRFGKKQTVYAKTLNEVRQKLRNEQYEDEKSLNVVTKDVTLDEWYQIWMDTCKKNCRESTKTTYAGHYRRVQKALGWRKLTALNLIIIQQAINELDTDNERKNSKKILVDMLDKAIDSDLLIKNAAKQVNTVISKEEKKERRVLTVSETELFLSKAADTQDEYKDLVFATRNNRPTQQFIIQECMDVTTRQIQKEHPEFERFSPHCFRHTFATRAIENGMQPKSLQKILGHGSLQLTMDLYCHVTEDTLFEAMELMEKVM